MTSFDTITATTAQLRAGSLSPVALMEATLDRIARLDPKLHSFICLADDPLESARAAGCGCAFNPPCVHATSACMATAPVLEQARDGRDVAGLR